MSEPMSHEAEQRVLGVLLRIGEDGASRKHRGARDAVAALKSSYFYAQSHGHIFEAIRTLLRDGQSIDAVTVVDQLTRMGKLDDAGGKVRIAELSNLFPATTNVLSHAKIVKDNARRRAALKKVRAAEQTLMAGDDGEAAKDLVFAADLLLSGVRGRVLTFDDVVVEYQREKATAEGQPIRLGFGTIDSQLRGVIRGQVLGIAARSGVGKSWFQNAILNNVSRRPDVGTLVLSLEMPATEWVERQLAVAHDEAPERIEERAMTSDLVQWATPFLERMKSARIVETAVTLDELPGAFAEARASLGDTALKLVLVDYMGLVDAPGKSSYERMSNLARGLKMVAKREAVAIAVAIQLSRAGGDGSQPVMLDQMRDSGVVEESVDYLIGAWQPGLNTELDDDERDELEDVVRTRILKNRGGPTGKVVDLRYHHASRRLYEPADPFEAFHES